MPNMRRVTEKRQGQHLIILCVHTHTHTSVWERTCYIHTYIHTRLRCLCVNNSHPGLCSDLLFKEILWYFNSVSAVRTSGARARARVGPGPGPILPKSTRRKLGRKNKNKSKDNSKKLIIAWLLCQIPHWWLWLNNVCPLYWWPHDNLKRPAWEFIGIMRVI